MMPITELRRTKRLNPESIYLNQFAYNITSQCGEDGIISKIFDIIGVRNQWCVEFGAWDGKYLSNTWNLIHNKGWSAVLLEGNSERSRDLAKENSDWQNKVLVKSAYVGWEGNARLDVLLSDTPIPKDFDLLSIDVDGNDFHIWNKLKNYRPRLIVVEFNPTASNDFYFVQDADPSLNQGSSLLAFTCLAKEKGYELAATTTINAIFVLAEDFPKLGIKDNSLEAMFEVFQNIEIMQGYDGTFFAAGHMYLNWHGLPLINEDFQVLPTALRKYRDPGIKA